MKLCKWSAVVLLGWGLSWAASWAEADEQIHQMLPLAVGNSWFYSHFFGEEGYRRVTISITHTEDIEGHTYHVFSDMPYEDPPVDYFFLAGKKVRWEGDRLLFRQPDRDVALYRFGGYPVNEGGDYSYAIPETESDTLVFVVPHALLPGLPRKAGCPIHADSLRTFSFRFNDPLRGREVEFLENFGMTYAPGLHAREAVINGEKWDFWNDPTAKVLAAREESPCIFWDTSVRKLSWGVLKQEFIHLFEMRDLK